MAILFLIKVVDNIIMTAKSITTYKGMKVITAALTIISQFIFYLIISKVVSDNTITAIAVVSVASGIGTYIAIFLSDRFQKDSMWTNIVTSSDQKDLTKLCDELRERKIKYIVNDSYTRSWQPTYSVIIFAMTKHESKAVDEYLDSNGFKYMRQVLK